jgi:hypothetical protein
MMKLEKKPPMPVMAITFKYYEVAILVTILRKAKQIWHFTFWTNRDISQMDRLFRPGCSVKSGIGNR